MNKRALLFLVLLLMLPGAAFAKLGVFKTYKPNAYGTASQQATNPETRAFTENCTRRFLRTLERFGVDYDMIDGRHQKTEWARLGYWVDNITPSSGTTIHNVDAFAFPGYGGGSSDQTVYGKNAPPSGAFRPDSLSRVALHGWQVPVGYFIDNALYLSLNIGSEDNWSNDAGGLVAASSKWDSSGATGPFTNDPYGQTCYLSTDPTIHWHNGTYVCGFNLDADTPGGVRTLVGQHEDSNTHTGLFNVYSNSNWPDSLWSTAAPETALVWERLWANLASCPTAKRTTYVKWGGAGASDDSASGNFNLPKPYAEGDAQTLLLGLAHLDSLTGGKVFFTKAGNHGPPGMAIIFRHVLGRSSRYGRNAIYPSDSSVFFSSLDSLKAWGVPVTFCVNVDSASSYPTDVAKLKAMPNARFIPEVWDGCGDTTRVGISGQWTAAHPVDIFGRYRNRAFYGDGSAFGADSSIWAGLCRVYATAESIFGSGRVLKVVAAPDDDWTPKNINRFSSYAAMDSLQYIFSKLGLSTVIFNGQFSGADAYGNSNTASPNATNPAGYYGQRPEGTYSGTMNGQPWRLTYLGHYGSGLVGGVLQSGIWSDTTAVPAVPGNLYQHQIFLEVARIFSGFCWGGWNWDHDTWPTDNFSAYGSALDLRGKHWPAEDIEAISYPQRQVSIKNFYASDLSGDPNNPARVGLWATKSIWNSVRAINKMAGRTVINMTYPDQIRPR